MSVMRIGLDASRVLMPTGEGTYTREIVHHLITLFPEDHFYVVVPEFISLFKASNVDQILYKEVDGIWSRIKYAFKVGEITRKFQLDVFHNITNYAAFGAVCPVITNVMDLATLKYPEIRGSLLQYWIYKYVFPLLLSRSRFLVVISKSTGKDVTKYYGLGKKVKVVYCGIDQKKFNTSRKPDQSLLERFNLPPDYLLFVGYLSPKKNLETLLYAMHQLLVENFKVNLVLVGKRGYGSESFFSLVEKLDLSDNVLETGFVSNEELTLLYQNAGLFVFPSIYEGFGLPVVEAMACGTPVLISNAGSLTELVDDPDCLCEPLNVSSWVNKLRYALTDNDFRTRSCEQGVLLSKKFSWEDAVRKLHKVYVDAVSFEQKG